MNNWFIVIFLIIFCFVINIPFGMWRSRVRKFSIMWFIAIHASVPLVITLRLLLKVNWVYIPAFILVSVLGQFVGGKMKLKNKTQ